MSDLVLVPIGHVESTLTAPATAPKQAAGAPAAWVVFDPAVEGGLGDVRVGDEVLLLTWLHGAARDALVVHPRDDPAAPLTGVFATRSGDRPNPIGLHPARVVAIDGLRVRVDHLEAIDGTPVIDMKPVLHPAEPAVVASAASVGWGAFAAAAPELAAFGAGRLLRPPAYLATVRGTGAPRVHPVTPVITDRALLVFMEPTSPKGRDLEERRWFALHNGVPDTEGTGGEFAVTGTAQVVTDPDVRAAAISAASYEPADHYVLFELQVSEARGNGYGDVVLPNVQRWRAESNI